MAEGVASGEANGDEMNIRFQWGARGDAGYPWVGGGGGHLNFGVRNEAAEGVRGCHGSPNSRPDQTRASRRVAAAAAAAARPSVGRVL